MTAPTQEFNSVQFIVDDLSQKIGQLTVENAALRAELTRRDQAASADTEPQAADQVDPLNPPTHPTH